jgi:mono/diheme cytochrome c family protein
MVQKIKYFSLIISLLVSVSTLAQTKKKPKSPVPIGKKTYDMVCGACHQADGNGVPGMNPPLSKTEWVLGDKARLINVVLKGLTEPIEINEESYNAIMPAQDYLSDVEIANVLTYIRNNFGNKASAISADEVKAQRTKK